MPFASSNVSLPTIHWQSEPQASWAFCSSTQKVSYPPSTNLGTPILSMQSSNRNFWLTKKPTGRATGGDFGAHGSTPERGA